MTIKKIEWTPIGDGNKIYGIINGIILFEIEYEKRYWEISSIFLYKVFKETISIDDKAENIIYKKFKTIEKAKKYCEEELMKLFHNIFFEDDLKNFKNYIKMIKNVTPSEYIHFNVLFGIIDGLKK